MIQVATSADVGWTTWPLHQSYPPIMEQIVLEAAAGRLSERNVRVGQPIDRALPASAGGAAVEVTRPDDARVAAKLQPSGDVSLFHFEETDLAGLYRAKFAAPLGTESLFAANPDPTESDPAKLDRAGPGRGRPRLEVHLPDQLARPEPERHLGRPPRRVAPPVAVCPPGHAPGRVGDGLVVRPPPAVNMTSIHAESLCTDCAARIPPD